jgi:hypothetical protein
MKCKCSCHADPSIKHVVACCNSEGWEIRRPYRGLLDGKKYTSYAGEFVAVRRFTKDLTIQVVERGLAESVGDYMLSVIDKHPGTFTEISVG